VDARDPKHSDEPALLEEWEKADAAMNVTGAACLDLLQSTFHAFLGGYMNQIGNKQVIPELNKMGQKSWFGNYRAFFAQYLQIEWTGSGADLDLLEQVILTRNDFIHGIDLPSFNAYQTQFHADKYPNSAFVDPRWKTLFLEHARGMPGRS
jgi:hypothetical protein